MGPNSVSLPTNSPAPHLVLLLCSQKTSFPLGESKFHGVPLSNVPIRSEFQGWYVRCSLVGATLAAYSASVSFQ